MKLSIKTKIRNELEGWVRNKPTRFEVFSSKFQPCWLEIEREWMWEWVRGMNVRMSCDSEGESEWMWEDAEP